MTQLSLTLTPASRRTDSAASKRAERTQNDMGWRESDAFKVLKALCETPNSTSKSLAERWGFDRYMTARRLPDLKRNDYADRIEDPMTKEWRWSPTEKGKQAVGVKTC